MNDFLDQIRSLSPQRLALLAVKLKEQLDNARRVNEEPIAVIGVGCRFPGASSPAEFWELLRNGREGIREVPSARWSIDEYFDPDPDAPGKISSRMGGFLEHIDGFDPAFFGIAPREAAVMDPQQRLLLEVSWESLENAGIAPASLMGSRTGVYIGICNSDYHQLLLRRSPSTLDAYLASGNAQSVASGRLSYVLGLQGPCMTIDTSCSASLVAIHSACQSLRLGESSMALAGGVNLVCAPETSIALSKGRMLAADGRCKTFDAAADGFSRGEGCGVVVLKRLSDARRDRNRILAVVRGSAINQDGKSSGLTVPNGPAQESVIRDALAMAHLNGSDIDYVEAHGTGTSLGDPIEVRALGRVLGEGRHRDAPLLIGSVKTNIGHLESAAGVAGFIKVVLSLQNEAIPRHLNFKDPNPFIEWASLPVAVADQQEPWLRGTRPRRAGVSSFGFSGTNAHLILEEAPPEAVLFDSIDRPLHCLTVSAQSEASLLELTRLYADAMAPEKALRLADVAYLAGTGRSHLTHRLAVVAADPAQARAALLAAHAGEADPMVHRGKIASSQSTEVVFLYTGAGAQYPGMGNGLYETSPVFREAIDHCDSFLGPDANGLTLKSVMAATTESAAPIHEIGWAQPAMFVIEYALTKLWRSWGVVPSAVIGHSVGEYAAACAAGVFSLEDGLGLIAERGRLMQSLPPGGMMAALFAPIDEIEAAIFPLRDRVAIAAFNAPGSVVISGETSSVETVLADFARRNVIGQRLFVSLAAHSPLMEPALDRMETLARSVAMSPPTIPIAWNLTGRPLPNDIAPDAMYWRSHMREPVRFADGIKWLYDDGFRIFLEVGPHPTLLAMAQQTLPDEGNLLLTSLRRGKDDWNELLTSLADLHVQGVPIDFAGFDGPYQRRRISLPTYPFDRERYWAAPIPRRGQRDSDGSALAKAADAPDTSGLYYKIEWEPAPTAYPLRRPSELKEEAVDRFKELAAQNDFAVYNRSRPEFDRLTVDFICKALADLGFVATPGRRFSVRSEASLLGIAERHFRLFEALMVLLARHGILIRHHSDYVVSSTPTGDPFGCSNKLLIRFSEVSAELEILRRCGAELARVLTGAQDPLKLLFDEPGLENARRLYAESPFARTFNGTLASLLQRAAMSGGKRPLRILEIGAGTGGTTQYVLPTVGSDAEYTFTDISPLFLAQAKDRFKGHPQLRTALLDIERSPAEQGFAVGAFDIVIASNAMHATADIKKSMQHIGDLLVPSGLFFAIEGLAPETWVNVTFGLTEGWWHSTDLARRPSGPLLEAAGWRRLLAEVGFSDVVLVPDHESDDGAAGQAIIMAAWPEKRRRWVVLSDGGDLARAFAAPGDEVELIEPREWRAALSSPDLIKQQPWWPGWVEEGEGPLVDIIHFGALETGQPVSSVSDLASREAFVILQAAAGLRSGRIWLVTRGSQDVRGPEDVIAPNQAGLWGLGRTFSLEHPAQWGGMIDLDPTTSASDGVVAVREAVRDPKEPESAWRGGERFVPRLAAAAAPAPRAYSLRSDLSYLITGGLGGLGLAVAEWLVARGARNLVLIGRTPLPAAEEWPRRRGDQRIETVIRLREAGVIVNTVAADVSDEATMTNVMARFGGEWPPLGGVVHAAVAPTAAALTQMTPQLFESMFRTKVSSHRLIERLSAGQPLAFFVDFSSTTALLGSSELAHYAAANAVLDALACRRRADGKRALSVNWGIWDKLNIDSKEQERIFQGGLRPIPTSVGIAALEALLAADATRAIVADVDWQVLRSAYESRRPLPLLSRIAVCEIPLPLGAPESLPPDLVLLDPEERRATLEKMVRRDVAEVVGLKSPQSIDADLSLFKMGLDSLMAIQLQRRLERTVAETLPAALVFNYPTVEALVELLGSRIAARIPAADRLDISMDLLSRVDELSSAEIDSLLNQMLSEEGTS
jgi:acyl transferase domain-containing protein/SAM-dependent methyltransferase